MPAAPSRAGSASSACRRPSSSATSPGTSASPWVTHAVGALDAAVVLQTYSRLVIDCNRDPAVPSRYPGDQRDTPIPGNVGLSATDRAARAAAIFTPYHDRIAAVLDARATAGRRTVLVAMHSFTPVFKGERRDHGRSACCTTATTAWPTCCLRLLRGEGDLIVGDNEPYAITDTTDYGVPVHGECRGLPHVEIEIRQDLIANQPASTPGPSGSRACCPRPTPNFCADEHADNAIVGCARSPGTP